MAKNLTPEILDTNVLLRFLVGDNKLQQKQAETWFAQAQKGEKTIIVKSIIVAEASFVLELFYKKSRGEIANALEVFLSQRWLQVEERVLLLELLKWYQEGFHFVDSFLIAWAHIYKGTILTFDRKIHNIS